MQEKDDEISTLRKGKEELEEEHKVRSNEHKMKIDEINEKFTTIMQEKDDEINTLRKGKERLEKEHKKELEDVMSNIKIVMQQYGFYHKYKMDLNATMQDKLKNNHDTVAKNKDDTIEPLKGKKQLELKHDVAVEEETVNNKTLRKTKEESQNVLKAKEVKTKEVPKQILVYQ